MSKSFVKKMAAGRWLTWMPVIGLVLVTLALIGMLFAMMSSGQQIGMYVDETLRPDSTVLFQIIVWVTILLGIVGFVLWIVGTFIGWPLALIYRRAPWTFWLGYGVVIVGWVCMIGLQLWARSFSTEELVNNRSLVTFVRDGKQLASMVVVFGSMVLSIVLQTTKPRKKEIAK